MHNLAEMFELPHSVVHSLVSKMIISEELQVSIATYFYSNLHLIKSFAVVKLTHNVAL